MFIAEIGINHDGDIYKALDLIKIAKDAGADVVKFQKRNVEKCVPKDRWDERKLTKWGEMSYIDYKYMIEFGKAEYDIIDKYCKDLNIPWTASVWDIDSYEFISQYNVPFIKIASPTITNINMLKKIKHPVVFSTGMSDENNIDEAFNNIENCIGIMHCISAYPPKDEELNLDAITTLKDKYPVEIGYSSHYPIYDDLIVAKMIGASIFEKHITINKNDIGSDHHFSLEPNELKRALLVINSLNKWSGDGMIGINDSEKIYAKKLRVINRGYKC
jgi:N-acetylneuraminate synthase